MSTQTCCRCKVDKPLEEFTRDKHNKSGRTYDCKVCRRDKEKVWRDNNKGAIKEINARSKNLRREYYQSEAGVLSSRRAHLKRLYNMTLEEYDNMFIRQGGKCAICGGVDPRHKSGILCVDHCHITGEVRALLCGKCNPALGGFDDNITILLSAIEYLKRFEDEKNRKTKDNTNPTHRRVQNRP